MNNLSWRLSLAAMCAVLTMFGRATPVFAAEEDHGGPGDRLERLERRVNEMAQRQEQLMQRLGAAQERQGPMAGPGRENFRPPMAGLASQVSASQCRPWAFRRRWVVPEAGSPAHSSRARRPRLSTIWWG